MHPATRVPIAPAPRAVTFAFRRGRDEYVFIDGVTFDEMATRVRAEVAPPMGEGDAVDVIVVHDRVVGFASA